MKHTTKVSALKDGHSTITAISVRNVGHFIPDAEKIDVLLGH